MASQSSTSPPVIQTVEEIMRIMRSLPPRPTLDEVAAAMAVLKSVESEEKSKLDEISNQKRPPDVPEELFFVLQETRKNLVLLQSHEQSKEALFLADLDKRFQVFDELIQRASELVSGDNHREKHQDFEDSVAKIVIKDRVKDDSLIGTKEEKVESFVSKKGLLISSASIGDEVHSDGDAGKLSLIKVASIIETSSRSGVVVLDLQGKLMDQIDWLPLSLGKLSDVTDLNLSENQIMALPTTIGSLKCLIKLDIHSNQLINLPDSFGELVNLTNLNLRGNHLRSLPTTFGDLTSLVNLDLSSNQLSMLPHSFGNLTSLKALNVETNELEELPHTIKSCSSLVELRLDFNQLKALPEAIGKLECLEILTVHYNRVKRLPSTMESLSKLRQLDVSFNELESIPETLCFATNLVKLNLSGNFADLRSLPRSIGNLEMLEELDISNNQMQVLPYSFRFLSKLRVFVAEETPLELPPRQTVKLGAQAVVEYMNNLVVRKDVGSQPPEKKGFWIWLLSLFRLRGKKRIKGVRMRLVDFVKLTGEAREDQQNKKAFRHSGQ